MSCVREASPSPTSAESDISARQDVKKKRFHPLRGLRRIFRRKGRPACVASDARNNDRLPNSDDELGFNQATKIRDEDDDGNPVTLESSRCHSTSHLTDDPETQRRNLSSTVLSVSHDSVFTAEQRSPNSGSESSLYNRKSKFSNSNVQAELFDAVRRRRACESNGGSDDEDLGLSRSSVSSSPTATTADIFSKAKVVTKSSQSIYSDASLLSIGSYDIDEQEFTVRSSRHSSKLSLHEKRYPHTDAHEKTSPGSEKIANASSNKDGSGLCHNAAKHKIAIKPKRTHGLPHKKKQMIASTLPSTPELIEDGSSSKNSAGSEERPNDRHRESAQFERSALIETVAPSSLTNDSSSITTLSLNCENNYQQQRPDQSNNETCSLPSEVTLTTPTAVRLCRSKSNVTANSSSAATKTGSEENNFFVRLLSKRGSKKKRTSDDHSPTKNNGGDGGPDAEQSLVPNERQRAEQPEKEEQLVAEKRTSVIASEKELTGETEQRDEATIKTSNRSAVQRKRLRSADSFKIYRNNDVPPERASKVRSKSDSFSSDIDAAALPTPLPQVKRNSFEIRARSGAERQPSSSSSSRSSSTSSVNKCRTSFRRQRMEPLNLGLDEDVLVATSVAPSPALKKSFSFCERETSITATTIDRSPPPPLPVEDTISLPVDIGRIIKDTGYHLEKNCAEFNDVGTNDGNVHNVSTPASTEGNDIDSGDDVDDNSDDQGRVVNNAAPLLGENKNDRDTSTVFVRCLSAAATDISSDAATSEKSRGDCGDVNVIINSCGDALPEQNNNGITIDIVSSDRKPLLTGAARLEQHHSQKLIVSVNGGADSGVLEFDEDAKDEIGINNDSTSNSSNSSSSSSSSSGSGSGSSNDFSPLRRILQISTVDNSINRSAATVPVVTVSSNLNSGGSVGTGSSGLSSNKSAIASRLIVQEHAPNNNSSSGVVLRRKSKERVESRTDDEPELMKVFARRSLKLKESDDVIGTDESSPTGESAAALTKSRDSDKENEGSDSPPPEGRKKKDTAAGDTPLISIGTGSGPIIGQLQQKLPANNDKGSVGNAGYKFGPSSITSNNSFQRFQKNVNFNGAATADQTPFNNRYQLQRSKTSPILTDDSKPSDTKTAVVHYQRSLSKEPSASPASNDHQLLKAVTVQSADDQDNSTSSSTLPFKRIQQRREEWEKRAQLAMKVQYH